MPLYKYSPPMGTDYATPDELYRHFVSIAQKFADMEAVPTLPVYNAVPDRLWTGLLVIADGTNWNPGAGRGVYWYDESTTSWNKL